MKINSVNPLYIVLNKVDGYIEESNGNKYLTIVCADKNKGMLKKYTKLLVQWLISQVIMIKNKRKSILI